MLLTVEGLTRMPSGLNRSDTLNLSPLVMASSEGHDLLFDVRRSFLREGLRYGWVVDEALKALFLECPLVLA